MGTGELWSYITIQNNSRSQLRKQLKLSGSASLVIDLEDDGIRSTQSVTSLMKLVLGWSNPRPIMERLSSLRVMITDGVDKVGNRSPWQPLTEGHCWPRLRMLAVESDREQFRLHVRAPNLENLNLVVTNVRDWSHMELGATLFNLQWMGHHPREAIATFLQAAAQSPNLQSLCFGAHRFDAVMPVTLEDTPFWPKLERLIACFQHSTLSDIHALLTNAPHVTQLYLRFDALSETPWFPRRLHTLGTPPATLRHLVISSYQPEGGGNLLGAALMESVYDVYDMAILEELGANHMVIPPSAVPAQCSLLQMVRLRDVVIPYDFIDNLGSCPGLLDVDISICAGNVSAERVVTGGAAFPARCTQLESLHLQNVVLRPELIAELSQCRKLRSVLLSVTSGPVPSTGDESEDKWPDTNTILPLPNLTEFTLTSDSSQETDNTSTQQFSHNSAARYMATVATRLTLNLSRNVCILIAPLRTSDIRYILSAPGRSFNNLECRIDFMNPAVFKLSLSAGDAANPPDYGAQRKLAFEFNFEESSLTGLEDAIQHVYELGNSFRQVRLAGTGLEAIRQLMRRNPECRGLHHLLRRAKAPTAHQGQ